MTPPLAAGYATVIRYVFGCQALANVSGSHDRAIADRFDDVVRLENGRLVET